MTCKTHFDITKTDGQVITNVHIFHVFNNFITYETVDTETMIVRVHIPIHQIADMTETRIMVND